VSADVLDDKCFVVAAKVDRRAWRELIRFDDLHDAQIASQALALVGVMTQIRPVAPEVRRGRQ
jgi:hypothetical protein